MRTGASFVRTGETGVLVDRLPPGAALCGIGRGRAGSGGLHGGNEKAQSMDRQSVRDRAASEFDTERIVVSITALNMAGLEMTSRQPQPTIESDIL